MAFGFQFLFEPGRLELVVLLGFLPEVFLVFEIALLATSGAHVLPV